MAINRSERYEDLEVYNLELVISEDHVPQGFSDKGCTKVIHGVIPRVIGDYLSNQKQEYVDAFGIEDVSRVLTEGYEFSNGVVTEDFAITSSHNGGELVIGQVVSSNKKPLYGETSFDVIQAESFERKLSANKLIGSAIKSVYTVRTFIPPDEVKYRERQIREDLENEEDHKLDIEVVELGRGQEINWRQVMSTLDDSYD